MAFVPTIQQCPDCGRVVSFSSHLTVITSCASCGAVIRRKENGEVYSGRQLLVTDSNDLIQPGTTGKFNKKDFRVLGRIRAWFRESVVNYWTILFQDGSIALLAEGYGIYSILQPTDLPPDFFRALPGIEAGYAKKLPQPQEQFVLEKKDHCWQWELEGESAIPHFFQQFKLYELVSFSDKRITAFVFNDQNLVAYNATYLSFSELCLQNIKKGKPFTKEVVCKQCKANVVLKGFPYSLSFACPHCYYAHFMDGENGFIKKKKYNVPAGICIPLGAMGTISGIDYEVIGFAEKAENNKYHSKWREFTLYNRMEGFAFLSEYDGHWIYVRESCNSPVIFQTNTSDFNFNGNVFQKYNAYTYELVASCGEFPYNAFDNQKTNVKEYISPPQMWIMEKDGTDNLNWFLGEHISPSEITDSFKPCNTLPMQSGVGAVQPKGFANMSMLVKVTLVTVLSVLLLHFLIGWNAREKTLLNSSYNFSAEGDTINVVTQKFDLDRAYGNLQFKLTGNVDNSWFSVTGTLVNADNGKEYSIEKGIEFYHGFSDGESWYEGKTDDDAYLTNIPSGKYFLQIAAMRESSSINKVTGFNMNVVYDVPSHRNLVFALVLILIWPVGWYYLMRAKESERWSNSPFSKFSDD